MECWFSISDTCLRSHGKPTRLFFQSSIQGFPGGLFSLQKQMCVKQRYACYLYRRCKSKHLRSRREILFKGCKKNTEMSLSFSLFLFHEPQIVSVHLFLSSKGVHLLEMMRPFNWIIPSQTCTRNRTHTQTHPTAFQI